MQTERRVLIPMLAFAMLAVAAIAALVTALLMSNPTGITATPVVADTPAVPATASLQRVSALGLADGADCEPPAGGNAGAAHAHRHVHDHHVHERADGSRYATFTVVEGNTVQEYTIEIGGNVNVGNTLIDVDLDGDGVIDVVLGNGNTTGGNAIGSTVVDVSDVNVGNAVGNTNVSDNNVGNAVGNTNIEDNVVIADNNVGNAVGNTNVEDNVVIADNTVVTDNNVGNTVVEDNVVVVDSGNGNQIGTDNVAVDVDVTLP